MTEALWYRHPRLHHILVGLGLIYDDRPLHLKVRETQIRRVK